MASYSWVIISRANEGKLKEFEAWYDNHHLPEVCAVPGVTGARRYRVKSTNVMGCETPAWDSVAVYDFEGDDPEAVAKLVGDTFMSGKMTQTDTMAPQGIQFIVSAIEAKS